MSQHDMNVANDTGAAVRADLNNALAAIVSNNSGASAPSATTAFQWWADTTSGLLKLRNAANSAWITIGTLASTNLGHMPTTGGTFSAAIDFSNTDYMKIPVGTTAQRSGSPASGHLRYNSDLKSMEIYEDSVWIQIGDRNAQASKTANYTMVNSDETVLADGTSAGFTVTLPTAAGITGKRFRIKKIDTTFNLITIATTSSQTIDGASSKKLATENEFIEVESNGSNWVVNQRYIPFKSYSHTPTIYGTTTNPTKPTGVTETSYWQRQGSFMLWNYTYSTSNTTSAANGSGTYIWSLPSGLTVDSSRIPSTINSSQNAIIGSSAFRGSASSSEAVGASRFYDNGAGKAGVVLTDFEETSNAVAEAGSSNTGLASAASVAFSFSVRIPITNWEE